MTYLSQTDQDSMEAEVVATLDAICDIERPQYLDDGMGQRSRSWLVVATDVKCRLWRGDIRLVTDENRIKPALTTTFVVPRGTDLRIGDRIRLQADIWLVESNPVPRELTLVTTVSLVSLEGAEDPQGVAASAVSFIPSSPLVSDNVQDAIDELALASTLFERGTVITDSDGIDLIDVVIWRAPYDCTVVATRGFRVGGDGCIIRARRGDLPLNVSDLSLVNQEQWYVGQDVQNGTFAAGDALVLEVVSVQGTVTEVTIQVEFRRG